MELENSLPRPKEMGIVSQGADAVHRLAVGGNDALGFFRRLRRVPARKDLERGLNARAVTLDRRRTHRGFRRRQPAKCTGPWLR
ncbi:MAG: hypothetical protein AUG05_00930 [Actinobacteria bacterium 13_1_20CM_2_66_18]|nr:MAG: hypothetical protein AUG05_00930 [Actinobacteria bacterium 13_1_20CM_2_66_18]